MRLIDNFMPLVGYVTLLRRDPGSVEYQQVRGEVQRLMVASEGCLRRGEAAPADYDLARFIVCAWIDEVVLGSEWGGKGQWQREQLQRLYYNTFDAGVEAFEKLNQLGLEQKEVREVYFVCLSLGFKGRFINPGDDFLLDQLRSSNLKILTGRPAPDTVLFAEAWPVQGREAQPQGTSPSWLVAAALGGPLLLFGAMHLVFRFALFSVADKLF
jgi:type VI secretion system protein ImpK